VLGAAQRDGKTIGRIRLRLICEGRLNFTLAGGNNGSDRHHRLRLLGTLDLRNVVDDQDLKEQVDKARALLDGVSADALRNMPMIRSRVREGMAALATQMDALARDRVSRDFRFSEEGGYNSCATV